MKSNYKNIGDYIQLVDERNTGLQVTKLLGLSITKQFIPSVANIVGTDMENYKIIRRRQFACSTMQVRRDKKMPVALLSDFDSALISQAYPVFEVTDTNKLLPEYLMMWFTRREFDREACFYAIGGVRGGLEWDDFCAMQLPIPRIDKQQEILNEYNVIQNRIALNNQLISHLDATAQAIYKLWFVDFDFPSSEGLPYKSSGGEMRFSAELGKEIPAGWGWASLGDFFPVKTGKQDANIACDNGEYPFFTCSKETYQASNYSFDTSAILLTGNGDYNVKWYEGKFEAYQRTYVLSPHDESLLGFLFYSISYFLKHITSGDRGSVISFITKGMIEDYKIVVAPPIILEKVAEYFNKLNKNIYRCESEVKALEKNSELLLSRLATLES